MSEKIRYGTDDAENETGVPASAEPAPAREGPARAREGADADGDDTKASAGMGAAAGAVAGAVVLGPVGAVAGGVIGAAIGASNAADEDEPSTTGNVTDDDGRRVKRTYSGKFYEEGSLADVNRKDQI